MITIINCTPHSIIMLSSNNVTFNSSTRHYDIDGEAVVVKTYEPSGILPRCKQEEELIGNITGHLIFRMSFGEVENLPEPKPDTYYIVSALVAQACPERDDLLIPAHQVRDNEGKIIGCLGFSVL